jgi:hypothetical protein
MMKMILSYLTLTLALGMHSGLAQVPAKTNLLLQYLEENKSVEGELIEVVQDPEMAIYQEIFSKAEEKDPKWFREHLEKGNPGSPVLFDEKVMSKEQYAKYMKAWNNRKVVAVEDEIGNKIKLGIILTKEGKDRFVINIPNHPISTLTYSPETNSFSSMIGAFNYIAPIDSPKDNFVGEWKGHEWRSEIKGTFDTTKQNFAIGRTGDGKFGLIIYRVRQFTERQVLLDKIYTIRFFPVKKP